MFPCIWMELRHQQSWFGAISTIKTYVDFTIEEDITAISKRFNNDAVMPVMQLKWREKIEKHARIPFILTE